MPALSSPTATTAPAAPTALAWPNLFAELRSRQPTLATAAQLFLLGALPCLIAMALDPRTVNDISVWVKPTKFFISLALYFATLGWFFGYLPASAQTSRRGRYVVLAALTAGGLEMAWLISAAVMGVPAHFSRYSTAWAAAYNAAGATALVLLSAIVVQGLMIARDRDVPLAPAFRRALVLAALLSAVATLVTATTLSAGVGHWVGGTPTDAGGLPLMGWSRSGGDLRVAHFFALHMHQALALWGWLIVASGVRQPLRAVHLGAAVMLGWTAFTFVQALRGQPLIG
jgi:hypothetical protein